MTETEAQTKQILRWFRRGKTLTPLEALEVFGCGRLAARCWDLRQAGYKIAGRMVEVGERKRVKRYWLERKAA